MASKGKFSFIRKKEEPVAPAQPQPQIIQPHAQTPELNLLPNNAGASAPKTNFSFIKKSQSKKDQPPTAAVPSIEEKPKVPIESLFTDELLFNFTEKKEELPQPEKKANDMDGLFKEETKPIDNNTINFTNCNVDISSPHVSASSGSNKAGFSFIKKKDKPEDTNIIKPIDNPKPVNEFINKPFNINSQFEDNYESQLFSYDKREQDSVSSKKNSAYEAQNKLQISPKSSSSHSTPTPQAPSESNTQSFTASNQSSYHKDIPHLVKDLKPTFQPKPPKLTVESVKQSLKVQKSSSFTSFTSLISKIHSFKLKLKSLQLELASQNKQHDKLISDEQLAIEANDFEKADRIETAVKQLSNQIASTERSIVAQVKELLTTRKEELAFLKQSAQDSDTNSVSIAKLMEMTEEEMESFTNNELSKHNSESIRLKKMKEKLHFLKGNLDTEKTYLTEEEEKISKVIKTQSSDIFNDLDNLNKAKEDLTKEINELKRQLEEKENERDQLNIEIESKEGEIEAIKSNFTHDFSKIELKKRNYKENLMDYEEQERTYQTKNTLYETLDVEYNKRMAQMKQQIASYQTEIKDYHCAKEKITSELFVKSDLLKKEVDLFELSNGIQKDIEKAQKSIKSHSEDILSLRSANKLLENEISQIEIRIPALEEEKKVFVKSKNFKEAGRVSNELKVSIEKKNSNVMVIEENKRKIGLCESNLEKLTQQIAVLTEESKSKEREMNVIRYDYLNDYLKTLSQYKAMGVNSLDLTQEIQFTQEEIEKLEEKEYITSITTTKKSETIDYNDNGNQSKDLNGQEKEIEPIPSDEGETKKEDQPEEKEEPVKEVVKPSQNSKEELKNRIEELNNHLQQVIIEEDYEAADKIQTEIDQLNQELGK